MGSSGIINFTVDSTAPIISNIAVLSIAKRSALISFMTNELANSTLLYDNTTALTFSILNSSLVIAHNFSLSSLTAATKYYYNITACDQAANCRQNGTFNFTTLPSSWTNLFFDSFNRADSSNLGSNWTESGGRWEIENNRAHADDCDTPGDNMTSISLDLSSSTNAKFSFDWEVSGLDSNSECLRVHVNNGTTTVPSLFQKCGNTAPLTGTQQINLENNISLSSNMTIIFACINDNSNDNVYVDNVNITAYS